MNTEPGMEKGGGPAAAGRPRVLVATAQTTLDALLRPEARARLERGAQVFWRQDIHAGAPPGAYARALAETRPEILMTGWRSPLLTAAMLDDNPQLKCVVNLTGELKRYVERAVIERGVTVTNWADVPAPSVAEAALMMILASLRRTAWWQLRMHVDRQWRPDGGQGARWIPEGLFDKCVGLYGFGLIARKLVGMLKPFDVKVLVFSSWISEQEKREYGVETVASLRELFQRSDVVSIHTGVRPDTLHSVNAEILAAMRDGGHLVNTARGQIVDESALAAELQSGRLFAALDVFEVEPLPPESPFRGLPNCLLFPHEGGPTNDFRHRCGAHAVDQVERFARGEPLAAPLTLAQYDRMT